MESGSENKKGRFNVSALYQEYRTGIQVPDTVESDAAKAYAQNAFDRNGMRDRVFRHKQRQLAIERIVNNINETGTHKSQQHLAHNWVSEKLGELFRIPRVVMPLTLSVLLLCLLILSYSTDNAIGPNEGDQGEFVVAATNGYPLDVRMSRFIFPPVVGDRFSLSGQVAVERHLFHAGVVSTQLSVARAADEETLVSSYISYLDSVPLIRAEAQLANELRASVARLASGDKISNDVYVKLQQLLIAHAENHQKLEWFELGKTLESLRLTLQLSTEVDNATIINELRPLLRWPSEPQLKYSEPQLQHIVGDIRGVLDESDVLSRLQQRYLLDQLELANALLR